MHNRACAIVVLVSHQKKVHWERFKIMQKDLKVLFVGEPSVGKTSLIFKLITGGVPEEWRVIAGFSEIPQIDFTVNSLTFNLRIYDSWGLEEYDRLRALLYADTDVFVMCFDISDRQSFDALSTRFIPELKNLMPDTPILLVGNKADLRSSTLNGDQNAVVGFEEPYLLARRLGSYYVECSALGGVGVVQVMEACVHLWRAYNRTMTVISHQRKLKFLSRKQSSERIHRYLKIPPLPPFLTLPGPLPSIEVPKSIYSANWLRLFEEQVCTDVQFVFDSDELPIEAHKMALISASHRFEQLFMGSDKNNDNKSVELFTLLKCSCGTTDPKNRLAACAAKACTCKAKVLTTMCREACSFMLKVLYSGGSELFKNASEKDKKTIVTFLNDHKLRNELNCDQFTEKDPSIPSSAVKAKKFFLNKSLLSDVTFTVEGHVVSAHKAVLIARSEVMARMLMGPFVESTAAQVNIEDAPLPSFLALLEYMYTDTLPEDATNDPVELMVLADRFGLPRLVALCEQLIADNAGNCLGPLQLIQTTSDATNLLNIAKACNADQLTKWCLQFIATNYVMFGDKELGLVDSESREYIEEHRWPTSSYFRELEVFKKRTNRHSYTGVP